MYVSIFINWLMEDVKHKIKQKLLFAVEYSLKIALKNRIFKNLWNVMFQFDMQPAEFVMGLIIGISIFGWGKVEPWVPYGNFWAVYFTFLGGHTIYAALDVENERYLWNRIKAQGLYFITSIVVMFIIHGLNLDGKNHGGEGAMVFWYLPPVTSAFFMLRNYLDLRKNRKKKKRYGF